MYLPTDDETIYSVLIDKARTSRNFWLERLQDDPTPMVRTSVEHLTGRIWLLMDLRDGMVIV